MNSRERVANVLAGKPADRIPLMDSYWATTEERWHNEGLPRGVSPGDYFRTDEVVRVVGDYTMLMPERVLEEDATSRLYWDAHADVDWILDDYFDKWFGPSGPAMQKYYDLLENAFSTATVHGHEDTVLPIIYSDAQN